MGGWKETNRSKETFRHVMLLRHLRCGDIWTGLWAAQILFFSSLENFWQSVRVNEEKINSLFNIGFVSFLHFELWSDTLL